MFTKQMGTVTVHFEPLIVVIAIIAIIFVWYIIQGVILNGKCKKIIRAVTLGEYDLIIEDGEKVLKIYTKYNKRRSTKNLLDWIEYLHFALAVSYFARSNTAQFLEHINCLNQNGNIKNFWLSLFYLQNGDFVNAQIHYEQIECCEETQTNLAFLDAVTLERQGKCEEAKEKIYGVYKKLNHPILKQIAEKI